MPLQPIAPTWLAWNNCNFTMQSGVSDSRTGQDFPVGGLSVGDYFDATEKEANAASHKATGLLHWGRYRLVQVDSGATAANVRMGMIAWMRQGSFVESLVISTAGTGGTPGTYTISIPAGTQGGSGAQIQVVVGSSGAITATYVLQAGRDYLGPFQIPAALLTAIPGLTGAILYATMGGYTPNIVTSYDVAQAPGIAGNPVTRPFIFLNSITPGNFGFVQEFGIATVTPNLASVGPNAVVVVTASGIGTGSAFSPSILGTSLGWSITNGPLKILMAWQSPCQD